jgi:hypothetical protein
MIGRRGTRGRRGGRRGGRRRLGSGGPAGIGAATRHGERDGDGHRRDKTKLHAFPAYEGTGAGSLTRMAARDDDDWVGTPPEGHITRDRAKPEFWQNQWQPAAAGAVLFVLIVIVLLLALL